MKKSIILIFFVFYCFTIVTAQNEISSFNATASGTATTLLSDYQCLGLNAANLGFLPDHKRIHLGMLETGVSMYSDALRKTTLRKEFLKFNDRVFSHDEKVEAANAFTNGRLALNADVTLIGIGIQDEKIGGFAFSVRERTAWDSYFTKDVAEIAFLGMEAPYFDSIVNAGTDSAAAYSTNPMTISQLLNGSSVTGRWYREYNFGYGRKIFSSENLKMYVGASAKYIQGFGVIDLSSENGKLTAFSALSPFFNIDIKASTPSVITKTGMAQVGHGFGFDGGVNIEYKKFNLGLAINDLGSVTWDGNVYEAVDTNIISMASGGFNNYNLFKEADKIISDSGLIKWKGLASKKISLATNMRAALSYKLSPSMLFGVDIYMPLDEEPGSYEKAIISAGGTIKIHKIIDISAGIITGGNYDFNVPAGIVVRLSEGWEAGVSTRDLLTIFSQKKPTLSVAFGFLRFKFLNSRFFEI